jgi:hypothetical protein
MAVAARAAQAVADAAAIDLAATALELNMCKSSLAYWQQVLVARLEGALGRQLVAADMNCIVWNVGAQSLTVEIQPLLGELRNHNLISNVFRARKVWH